jgi:hypothetical protein
MRYFRRRLRAARKYRVDSWPANWFPKGDDRHCRFAIAPIARDDWPG